MPELFDIVELTIDIPEEGLRAGMQGTIVDLHGRDAYEVEFSDESGETLALLALRPGQFIVVWQSETGDWLPISEQVATLVADLPEDVGREVLDFARFLHLQKQRQRGESLAELSEA
jgi:hypothetical protein